MKPRTTSISNVKDRPGLGVLRGVTYRVLSLARPQLSTLIWGFVGLAGGSAINLLFPYLIGKALNEELGFSLKEGLPLLMLTLFALFALQSLCFYVRHFCFYAVGHYIVAALRNALYRAIMEQDIEFFDRSKVGDLLSRLASDTQVVQRAVTVNVSVAVRYILQVLGGVAMMLFISWKLTLIILLSIPLITVGGIYWGKKLKILSRQMQAELGAASTIAEESTTAVRTVRVYTGDELEIARYKQAIDASLHTGIERSRVGAMFSSVMVFILHTSIALILWYGVTLVFAGNLSTGTLTSFLLYCVIVAVSFGFLASTWDEFMQAVGASERIFEIIDSHPEIVPPAEPHAIAQDESASIAFEHVSFAYPARSEVGVLHDVSFEIPPGGTTAIVGPSGSGKSTIASLIPRFYDPKAGIIRYCGVDIRKLDPVKLRSEISFVAQDSQVFSVSIFENIRYGKPAATRLEIEQAAKAAQLTSFINTLPQGFDTLVGNRGVQLSGGERQRIAIARAILKDPRFLILDEATSALDSENEHLVQQALKALTTGRTTLVIAHRLSTVQHADCVLVLRDGSIVQRGSHAELVGAAGLYRTLVEHQLL